MSHALFRTAVMQARQAARLDGIRVGHKPNFSAVAGVALLLAGCLVTFAVWGQVANKSSIRNVLIPLQGTVQLSAIATGVLTDQLVQEDQQVTFGQTLFVLGNDRSTAEGSADVLLAVHLQREQQSLHQRQLSIDLSQLDQALASLAQEHTENQSRQTIVITAPQSGVVSSIHLPKGASVQAGQTMATLVPADANAPVKTELQASLYAPSRTAGFIQPGQTVWMRYGAYPYQKFGLAQGRVQSISATPTAPQDLPNGQSAALQTAAQTQEPLYRIQVRLQDQNITAYGESLPLKPGMTLEADVVQEKRAVWEWIFEPVLAARQKVKVL